jgi:adenine-specific DNA methylase
MPRGNRFALNQPSRRDDRGHSLPSDKSMHYVELQLVCKQHPEDERPILGAWYIESHWDKFDSAQVNERANAAVERQLITEPDGTTRLRYKMTCPKCGQTPVYRQDRIDAALEAVYEKGAAAKVVRHAV